MATLIIYTADWDTLHNAGIYPTFPGGASSNILSQAMNYSNGSAPAIGERLTEARDNAHREPASYRPGPWVVASVERYSAESDAPEQWGEVVLARCEWSPLSDDENPWEDATPLDVGDLEPATV